jgi:hypothetical protein
MVKVDETSGFNVSDHFADVSKMVDTGKEEIGTYAPIRNLKNPN